MANYHVREPARRPYAEVDDARYYRKGVSRRFGVLMFENPGTEAVCLMLSASKRMACAWVTAPESGPVTITPLDTADPVVARNVEFGWRDPGNPGTRDKCGSCF